MSMTIEEIAPLYWNTIRSLPFRAVANKMVTQEDISAVETALSVTLPASVHYFLLHSPYGFDAFTSDFSNPKSIVWVNHVFHKNEGGYLPPFLLMWNNGHDGDCICFDTRSADENGEYPIVYWDYENMTEVDALTITPIAATFPEWLTHQAEHLVNYVR